MGKASIRSIAINFFLERNFKIYKIVHELPERPAWRLLLWRSHYREENSTLFTEELKNMLPIDTMGKGDIETKGILVLYDAPKKEAVS